MSVTADDCLVDRGVLEPKLVWPALSQRNVVAKVDEFLRDAASQTTEMTAGTDKDDAQRQWVYYRAYREVYQRLSLSAASIDVRDEGSRSFTPDQRDRAKLLMDEALAEFKELATPEAVEDEGIYAVIKSYR